MAMPPTGELDSAELASMYAALVGYGSRTAVVR